MLPLFLLHNKREFIMEEFKLYSVSDTYIDYLRDTCPNVYSNKLATRVHTRKYVGTVIRIENFNYYIPLSSPKESDYQKAGNDKVIKKFPKGKGYT